MGSSSVLGIIGGLGPMATAYFYELLTGHTDAERDQEHIDIYISSRASTPDRTDFITGKSALDPLPVLVGEAKKLILCGAGVLVIPCNTAHYFIEGVRESVGVPVLSMIEKTVGHCKKYGVKKAGILATEGTVMTGLYQRELEKNGILWSVPDADEQNAVTNIIYGQIKQGRRADMNAFRRASDKLRGDGCDMIILGCTELSMLKKQEGLPASEYVNSLEVLAYEAIKACGKKPCGFDAGF